MQNEQTVTLILSCPDRVGIVAAVSQYIAERQGWIVESNYHSDIASGQFFMRNVILGKSLKQGLEEFRNSFKVIADHFQMNWQLVDSSQKKRVVLLVSKQDHCLVDLLYRWKAKELDIDIPCVISNHADLRSYVEWHGIPYHHIPVTPETKVQAYTEVMQRIDEVAADVIVLARYMQILSPEMCSKYPGKVINIHHSFLPSFIGAKPYHQAFERGVKLIGATCHYVTEELDQGPIIEQDVVRVDHGDTAEDYVRYGRDVEKAVLARGLKSHLEDRVIINGHRTVVFR